MRVITMFPLESGIPDTFEPDSRIPGKFGLKSGILIDKCLERIS